MSHPSESPVVPLTGTAQMHDVEPHGTAGRYLREVVFAASDGLVTTFAVVAGSAGAHLDPMIIIILGFANLVGDGISMGLGEYLGSKSEQQYYEAQEKNERWEIENKREVEIQEMRDIFQGWGLKGQQLEDTVQTVIQDKDVWVDLMMKYELGLQRDEGKSPASSGFVMFLSFAVIGLAPLLPYLFHSNQVFTISIIVTAITMFTVGALRSRVTRLRWWFSGLEMLLVGTLAAGSAYLIGVILSRVFHIQ